MRAAIAQRRARRKCWRAIEVSLTASPAARSVRRSSRQDRMKQKTILISINAAWNIVNFRSGLIVELRRSGYRVMALAPPDAWIGRLEALGVEYAPIEMDRKGVSPAADLRLLWRYWRAMRRLRPDVFLGWTPKPNIWGSLAAHALGIGVINNVSGLGT